eukprot:Sdes_comp17291_c0_seq1m6487
MESLAPKVMIPDSKIPPFEVESLKTKSEVQVSKTLESPVKKKAAQERKKLADLPMTEVSSEVFAAVCGEQEAEKPAASAGIYVGNHIHHSSLDGKPLCSYSKKLCSQRRMDGFGFCIRHVLEDPFCPFKQCLYISKSTNKQCTNPIPKTEQEREYCNSHLQLMGLVSQTFVDIGSDSLKKKKQRNDEGEKDLESEAADQKSQHFEHIHNLINSFRDRDSCRTLSKVEKRKRLIEALEKHGISKISKLEKNNINSLRQKLHTELHAHASSFIYDSDNSSEGASSDMDFELQRMNAVDQPWWDVGYSDSGEESCEEDVFLKSCKVLTDEELALRRKQQLVKLRGLYKAQFLRLRQDLLIKHSKYLLDKTRLSSAYTTLTKLSCLPKIEGVHCAEGVSPAPGSDLHSGSFCELPALASEAAAYPSLSPVKSSEFSSRASRKYRTKSGNVAAVYEQTFRDPKTASRQCSHFASQEGRCARRVLPFSQFCFPHILHDSCQVLYTCCEYQDPFTGLSCESPVVKYQPVKKCEMHFSLIDVSAIDISTHSPSVADAVEDGMNVSGGDSELLNPLSDVESHQNFDSSPFFSSPSSPFHARSSPPHKMDPQKSVKLKISLSPRKLPDSSLLSPSSPSSPLDSTALLKPNLLKIKLAAGNDPQDSSFSPQISASSSSSSS